MKFEFDVGPDEEKQTVLFNRDPWFGNLTIETKDNTLLKHGNKNFSFETAEEYKFTLGSNDEYKIKILHTRKRFLGGFFPQEYTVYVNEEQIGTYRGY